MQLPSISVITPCFNAANTIAETIESVRSQDYPGVEHIVVDGGSRDGTVAILESETGLRWISEPDRGRVDAANKGAGMATGDVVAWLNADDRYEPGALRAAGKALSGNPAAAWATGYCRIIGADGREIRSAIAAYKNVLLRHWSLPLYLTQNFVADPATFVRRSALEEVGLLDERYRESHDYDLWLRVARRFGPPLVLRRELACFRMAEGVAQHGWVRASVPRALGGGARARRRVSAARRRQPDHERADRGRVPHASPTPPAGWSDALTRRREEPNPSIDSRPMARARHARPPASLALLLVAVALLGITWALLNPAWQSPDEQWHFGYAQTLAERGALPGGDGARGLLEGAVPGRRRLAVGQPGLQREPQGTLGHGHFRALAAG